MEHMSIESWASLLEPWTTMEKDDERHLEGECGIIFVHSTF